MSLSASRSADDSTNRTQVELQSSQDVAWFQPQLAKLSPSAVQLFSEYVGLSTEEEIRAHIQAVRAKAWRVHPYPCIGLFRFLDFSIHLSDKYPAVVSRVKKGEILLDLGCCFGQDLRKVAFDAGRSDNLVGADLQSAFLDLGYELFNDRGRFEGKFVAGDILDDGFLQDWTGKVGMVHLGSFLHLFDGRQQRLIVERVAKLLVQGAGALVFGRHIGAVRGGELKPKRDGGARYRHSDETLRNLWKGVAGGEWEVESSLGKVESASLEDARKDWQGDDTKQMMFSITRL